ncbi:hypothetical protein LINGRAHAP2_LOCUS12945 [Linum grandiflorum]
MSHESSRELMYVWTFGNELGTRRRNRSSLGAVRKQFTIRGITLYSEVRLKRNHWRWKAYGIIYNFPENIKFKFQNISRGSPRPCDLPHTIREGGSVKRPLATAYS